MSSLAAGVVGNGAFDSSWKPLASDFSMAVSSPTTFLVATVPYPPNCRTKLSNTVMAHVMVDSCATNTGSSPINDAIMVEHDNDAAFKIRFKAGSDDNEIMTGESNDEF